MKITGLSTCFYSKSVVRLLAGTKEKDEVLVCGTLYYLWKVNLNCFVLKSFLFTVNAYLLQIF